MSLILQEDEPRGQRLYLPWGVKPMEPKIQTYRTGLAKHEYEQLSFVLALGM